MGSRSHKEIFQPMQLSAFPRGIIFFLGSFLLFFLLIPCIFFAYFLLYMTTDHTDPHRKLDSHNVRQNEIDEMTQAMLADPLEFPEAEFPEAEFPKAEAPEVKDRETVLFSKMMFWKAARTFRMRNLPGNSMMHRKAASTSRKRNLSWNTMMPCPPNGTGKNRVLRLRLSKIPIALNA